MIGWAFARDALSADHIPLAARADAGHELGALLLLMAVALLAAGLAVELPRRPAPASPRARRLAGRALVAIARAALRSPSSVRGRAGAGRAQGPDFEGWDKLTNRTASTPANTPTG